MPRCKNCNEKFEAVRFNQKYCFNDECVKVWVLKAKEQNWKKEKAKKKIELMCLNDYHKIAQQIFNKYIRYRDRLSPCISCGNPPKKANCGHYFSQGGHSNVRYDEDNCHLQCEHCNTYLSGNLLNYQIGIEKRIGGERLLALHQRAHIIKKWSIDEVKEIISKYKAKVKEMPVKTT
jgi:hypothetical protein